MQTHHRALRSLAALCVALIALAAPGSAQRAQAQVPTASGDSDTFVEAMVNNTNPSQGDQIIYVFRYYQAVDGLQLPGMLVGQPDYEAPEFSNFWAEGGIEQSSTQTQLNGRTYNVSELRTYIFPTSAGTIAIEPARLILHGFPGEPDRVLETLPVTIAARPLPDGAPSSFTGAIGDYRLAANVDRTSATPTEPVTLQLRLSGEGNVRMAPAPVLPDLPGWRVQERANNVSIDVVDGRVQGTRTIDLLLLPGPDATSLTIPPIEYSFYNPATGVYASALSNPIALTLLDASGAPVAAVAPSVSAQARAAAPDAPDAAAEVASDAVPVATPVYAVVAPPARMPAPLNLADAAWFRALWILPLVALVLGVVSIRRARGAEERRAERQRTRAGSDALRALQGVPSATSAQVASAEACAHSQKVLDDYLARALGRPVGGLTRSGRAALLAGQGAPADLVSRVEECYVLAERARYSPIDSLDPALGGQMQHAVEAAIRDLDPILRAAPGDRTAPATSAGASATPAASAGGLR